MWLRPGATLTKSRGMKRILRGLLQVLLLTVIAICMLVALAGHHVLLIRLWSDPGHNGFDGLTVAGVGIRHVELSSGGAVVAELSGRTIAIVCAAICVP